MPFDTFPALRIGLQNIPIHFVRNPRARRYILRLRPDGTVRATVPGRGSIKEARAFAERNIEWLKTRLQQPSVWQPGIPILYRGQTVTLECAGNTVIFGDQSVAVGPNGNLRHAVERHLWQLAGRELPARTRELAGQHQILVHRVTVRNQRTRWGSCSRRGTISLNWRLIQTPAFVRDYIILHELMHRREMNHSARYWRQVAAVCPEYETAEKWLKQHRTILLSGTPRASTFEPLTAL